MKKYLLADNILYNHLYIYCTAKVEGRSKWLLQGDCASFNYI